MLFPILQMGKSKPIALKVWPRLESQSDPQFLSQPHVQTVLLISPQCPTELK